MDPLTIAAAMIPILVAFAGGAAKEAAKASAEKIGRRVFDLLRGVPRVARELEDLRRAPDDQLNSESLKASLAKALRDDRALAEELSALLESAGVSVRADMTLRQLGDGNKAAQVFGRDIDVEIQ